MYGTFNKTLIWLIYTALKILFRNLPAKSTEEALRHRQEYDEMVAEAKKRGMSDLTYLVHYVIFQI